MWGRLVVVSSVWFWVAWAEESTFALKGEKAWNPSTDAQFGRVRDRTQAWRDEDITECYSYNELYAESTIFCDRECMKKNNNDITQCGGPWYCSKTVICPNDRPLRVNREDPKRDCIIVRGCANHTDCFPNENKADSMNVVRPTGGFGLFDRFIRDNGNTIRFGGVKMRTYCCFNKGRFSKDKDYDYRIDLPCNSAPGGPRRGVALLAGLVAAAAAAVLLST